MEKLTGKVFNTSFGKVIIHDQQEELLRMGDIIEYDNKPYRIIGVPMMAGGTPTTKISLVIEEIETDGE